MKPLMPLKSNDFAHLFAPTKSSSNSSLGSNGDDNDPWNVAWFCLLIFILITGIIGIAQNIQIINGLSDTSRTMKRLTDDLHRQHDNRDKSDSQARDAKA